MLLLHSVLTRGLYALKLVFIYILTKIYIHHLPTFTTSTSNVIRDARITLLTDSHAESNIESSFHVSKMSNQDSNLRNLLSPSRSGTFFAPFRSRSANPDGFDSKMKLWIAAIEEWAVLNKKLIISLKDIHQTFVSDVGIRPDKECVRLVFSEMKRRCRLVEYKSLRTSRLWSADQRSYNIVDHYINPKGWLGWGVKTLVVNPASWVLSAVSSTQDHVYSDLTDLSITDNMRFVSQKCLHELSQNLLHELIRISKAEKQVCFEWQHLIELISPIVSTLIDATDSKELLELLDILIEYLSITKNVATLIDGETKLVKVALPDEPSNDDIKITRKDVGIARLLRAKELLTADSDRYFDQAQKAKQEALVSYNKGEVAKAKSLLRSHKRLTTIATQKEAQLENVESLLDQLENTNSNVIVLEAYKAGAEALKKAVTKLDNNMSVMDEMYDATAEAAQLNEEMNRMMRDITTVSFGAHDLTSASLEAELNDYIAKDSSERNQQDPDKDAHNSTRSKPNEISIDDLEERLNSLLVCQDSPQPKTPRKSETEMPSTAT